MRSFLFVAIAITAAAMAAGVRPAAAVDFTQVLMEEGCPISEDPNLTKLRTTATIAGPECNREKMAPPDLTLGLAVYHALMFTPQSEQATPTGGEEKQRRGDLAKRVRNAKDDTPSAEEIALMKKMLAALYGPVIISEAFPLLDPATKKK